MIMSYKHLVSLWERLMEIDGDVDKGVEDDKLVMKLCDILNGGELKSKWLAMRLDVSEAVVSNILCGKTKLKADRKRWFVTGVIKIWTIRDDVKIEMAVRFMGTNKEYSSLFSKCDPIEYSDELFDLCGVLNDKKNGYGTFKMQMESLLEYRIKKLVKEDREEIDGDKNLVVI